MNAHADAQAVLSAWTAPDATQAALQRAFIEHLEANDNGLLRECRPDHLTGSALVVRGDGTLADDVLLVMHSKVGKWLQTGGHCEPGDPTLAAAALRESREESGIDDLTIDRVPLRLSRHRVPFCGGGHHLDVQFLAIAPPDAQLLGREGDDPVAWFSDAPEPTDQDVRDLIAAARLRLRGTP